MPNIEKILVPVDFSPCSDSALRYALEIADACGAEVEVLHVWKGDQRDDQHAIFAETPEGEAMTRWLTTCECEHPARVCGRLEFGDDASRVILGILEQEEFDLVVIGRDGEGHRPTAGHVTSSVSACTHCTVVIHP